VPNDLPPPESSACPRCAGERLLADVGSVVYLRKLDSGPVGTFTHNSTINALVCTACGHIEFYARRPDRLR
jgi:hypothetical protein